MVKILVGQGMFEFLSLVTLWVNDLLSDRPGTGDAYASIKLVYFGLDIHWEFYV